MNITFLYHSAFFVELETCALLFDWYDGARPEIDPRKPLYVFSSHHHSDHYSPELFTAFGMENTWYLLGDSIHLPAQQKTELGIEDSRVFRLAGDRTLDLGPLHITTLPSTDAGVAFVVNVEGKTIYHAGDLHWWHWPGRPDDWNANEERIYKIECEKLRGKPIDVAFLVLDPRQKGDYWRGFDWAMRTLDIHRAFPMHVWEQFDLVKTLKNDPRSAPYRDRIEEIHFNGQQFVL